MEAILRCVPSLPSCLRAFQLFFLSVLDVNDRPMPLNEHSWDATICGISTSFSHRLTKISLQKTVPVVNRFLAFRGGRWQRLGIDHCLLLSKDPNDTMERSQSRITTPRNSSRVHIHSFTIILPNSRPFLPYAYKD